MNRKGRHDDRGVLNEMDGAQLGKKIMLVVRTSEDATRELT